MLSALPRPAEPAALTALAELQILDTPPEAEFDALVQAARLVCEAPISLISLVERDRQWFKANSGLPGIAEAPRALAFCAHAVAQAGVMVVPDALADARFADNPLVTGEPGIRFYAGAPLQLSNGACVGTLCVIDRQPRGLDQRQRELLQHLARAAVAALEGRQARLQIQQTRAREVASLRALTESQGRLQALSEASPLGVFFTDLIGNIGYCNQPFRAIVGWPAETPLAPGLGWVAQIHPDDRAAVQAEWRGCLARQLDFDMEFRILRPPGARLPEASVRHLRCVARPLRAADGSVSGHAGSIEDVTEQLQLRQRSHSLLDTVRAQYILSVADLDGRIVELNDAFCATSGWRRVDLLGRSLRLLQPAPEAHGADGLGGRVWQEMWHEIAAGRSWRGDLSCRAQDGRLFWLDSVVAPLRGADGLIERFVMISSDITHRHRQAEALAQANERFALATDSGGIGVWEYTVATGELLWDAWMCRLFGQPVSETPRRLEDWRGQVHPDDLAAAEEALRATVAGARPLDTEYRVIWPDGSVHHLRCTARATRGSDGRATRMVGVNWDVSDLRRLSQDLAHRASHDALTGLVNRTEFEARLQRLLERARADHSRHALLYIDLDQFKLVNDACGHAAGDRLLRQVGRLLLAAVRGRDTLARLGGDEFGLLLENCGTEQAMRVARKICMTMEDFRFTEGERRFRVGTSIGLVPVDGRWTSIAAIQQAADRSCYAAKEAGRNRVHEWLDSDAGLKHRHGEMQWAARIEQALDADRFVLYAQRVVTLAPVHRTLHAEVLLRMQLDDGTLVLPGAFLPAAERFNLASRIDRWVLRQAIGWMSAQPALTSLEMLCVNLSGQSVGDKAFHAWALAQLAATGPGLRARLCLEITETAAVTNLADAQAFIGQLRAAGVKVALDDFGAGASSFGYLKSLPVDFLKIDGRFVRELCTDPLAAVAVRCFVDLAKVVGVHTVAEYVESTAVRDRLRQMGVGYAQGHLIHPPAPLQQLLPPRRAAPRAERPGWPHSGHGVLGLVPEPVRERPLR